METPYAEKVIEENRRFYNSDYADQYDAVHPVHENHYSQKMMRRELRFMLKKFYNQELHAADIGCGTGTITFNLLRLSPFGVRVTAVDLAERMVENLKKKAMVTGQQDRVIPVVAETQSFLESEPVHYHLIGFASALHHFPDYLTVIRLAAQRLLPNGFLYIHQEPLRKEKISSVASAIQYVDTRIYFCLHVFKIEGMPRRVRWMKLIKAIFSPVLQRIPLIRPLLQRLSRHPRLSRLYDDGRYSDERMRYVEYHEEGLDTEAILQILKEGNMELEYFGNAPDKHYRFFYWLSRLFQAPSHFTLIARKK